MKNINGLNKALEQSIEDFRKQMIFDLETFEQHRTTPYLDKNDMEEISRQIYYVMEDFRKNIIEYLKDNTDA